MGLYKHKALQGTQLKDIIWNDPASLARSIVADKLSAFEKRKAAVKRGMEGAKRRAAKSHQGDDNAKTQTEAADQVSNRNAG